MKQLYWMALLLKGIAGVVGAGETEQWPGFRGPQAGVAASAEAPLKWDTQKNVAWRVEVPGRGWSSPVVWDQHVYLTTVVKNGPMEDAKKGLYFGGERRKPNEEHRWLVLCYDWSNGELLWQQEAYRGVPSEAIHVKNTYASETPVTDGENVYVYFGNLGVFAYTRNGKPLWNVPLEHQPTRFGWGTGASPVLVGDQLFVVHDNELQSFVAAFDKRTGKELWRLPREEKSNWATPYYWRNPQREELVIPGTGRTRSYSLDGKPLWEVAGMSSITIPTPTAAHDLLFIASGYILDVRKPLMAIKPGAMGDITPLANSKQPFIAWQQGQAAPYHPSPIVVGDYLYVLYDRGLLSCHDAKTGKQVYSRQRLGGGYTASPVACGDKILVLDEDGVARWLSAGKNFRVLAQNSLAEMCMATPAVLRGSVLIRTLTKLYRLHQNKEQEQSAPK